MDNSHVRLWVMKSLSAFAAIERNYPSWLCGRYKYKGRLYLWSIIGLLPIFLNISSSRIVNCNSNERKVKPEPNRPGYFLLYMGGTIQETKNKYANYLLKIAYNILFNNQDCEECLNDTYLSAWKCEDRGEYIEGFEGIKGK